MVLGIRSSSLSNMIIGVWYRIIALSVMELVRDIWSSPLFVWTKWINHCCWTNIWLWNLSILSSRSFVVLGTPSKVNGFYWLAESGFYVYVLIWDCTCLNDENPVVYLILVFWTFMADWIYIESSNCAYCFNL